MTKKPMTNSSKQSAPAIAAEDDPYKDLPTRDRAKLLSATAQFDDIFGSTMRPAIFDMGDQINVCLKLLPKDKMRKTFVAEMKVKYGLSPRTVHNWSGATTLRAECKGIANFANIAISGVYELCGPNVPKKLRDDILKRTNMSGFVSYSEVKDAIDASEKAKAEAEARARAKAEAAKAEAAKAKAPEASAATIASDVKRSEFVTPSFTPKSPAVDLTIPVVTEETPAPAGTVASDGVKERLEELAKEAAADVQQAAEDHPDQAAEEQVVVETEQAETTAEQTELDQHPVAIRLVDYVKNNEELVNDILTVSFQDIATIFIQACRSFSAMKLA